LINGFSQTKELVLKNKISSKAKVIHQGKHLKITCKDGRVFTGQPKIIDNSNIEIGDYTSNGDSFVLVKNKISFNDILKIKVNSQIPKILGDVLTVGGGLVTILGVLILINAPGVAVFVGIQLAVSASIITGGGIILLAIHRNYGSNKWSFSIE